MKLLLVLSSVPTFAIFLLLLLLRNVVFCWDEVSFQLAADCSLITIMRCMQIEAKEKLSVR